MALIDNSEIPTGDYADYQLNCGSYEYTMEKYADVYAALLQYPPDSPFQPYIQMIEDVKAAISKIGAQYQENRTINRTELSNLAEMIANLNRAFVNLKAGLDKSRRTK